MEADEIGLRGVQETLLVTLRAKAAESALPDSLLKDHFAADLVRRLNGRTRAPSVGHDMTIGIAVRAYMLDRWTRAFIQRYPDAVVLNLGCGLDTRVLRLDPPPRVAWFDIDFPDVIALRQNLFADRAGCTTIASSITERAWIDRIPDDRATIVVAEGVLPYLSEQEVRDLLRRLTSCLSGGEIVFDAYSRLGIEILRYNPSLRATGAEFRWGMEDARALERDLPGLTLLEEISQYDAGQVARLSPMARIAAHVVSSLPMLRRLGRLLRYRFSGTAA
ncbi:MAG TPA: class I SAM-dependent methyltransferase [Ensifer sp.]|jgi:O-methyltransferase involved in polyketide biosynthesis|uniref:class I SAM-dependent methyltransferase n=1 Tax=Ensifer sp. TaxID=1872086 RepID=UPI002E11D30C|nr:class I SAM-dependent methyltransferase [Ensifer sp.]